MGVGDGDGGGIVPQLEVSTVQAGLNVPASLRKPGSSMLLQSLGRPVPVSIWMPKPVGSKTALKLEPPIGLLPHVWYGFCELM